MFIKNQWCSIIQYAENKGGDSELRGTSDITVEYPADIKFELGTSWKKLFVTVCTSGSQPRFRGNLRFREKNLAKNK